ncbi:MAG: hypothetical protein AMJ75_05410 [Phycisphaerae bacterium SM1_79]|nr:MAG: hypothetical protein AMJ75_05410 [Phycisphaerae bacterium SM1_79]
MRECVLLLLILLLLCGCSGASKPGLTNAELERIVIAQKIELVEDEGGLALKVGDETVTSDEVIDSPIEYYGVVVSLEDGLKQIAKISNLEQFKKQARGQLEEIITGKISNILLYQHARKEVGEKADEALEKAADNELRKFVLDFGGDQAKADEALRQGGMDRESYKELQKRTILIQWYLTSKLPNNRPITYRDLSDCYNQMKDEFFARAARITFRLIDIQPARLEVADPNQDRHELAKKLANELLAQIQSGEDFGQLAKQYSHGDWREFGGLWRPVQPTSLVVPYDILAAEAEKIEPGQVAGPIASKEHIFIMKLEDKQSAGYEPFDRVQGQVEEKLIFDRQNEIFDRLKGKLMQQVELGETDEFIDFCLEEIYRTSSQ